MSYLIAGFGASVLLVVSMTSAAPLLYAAVTGTFREQVGAPPLRVREHPRRFIRFATLPVIFLGSCLLALCALLGGGG